MVQVEEMEEFCDFFDAEYKQIHGNVKTKWLSLQPAITRVSRIEVIFSFPRKMPDDAEKNV
jgi:hypothetical protein